MEDLKKTSPFTSTLSKEAAEAFIAKPDLLKKWCGFHNISLLYSEWSDYYIGKGYDNTERLIHLDQDNKLNGDYNIKEKKYLDNGKIISIISSYISKISCIMILNPLVIPHIIYAESIS